MMVGREGKDTGGKKHEHSRHKPEKPDEPGIIAKFFFYLFMILGALVSIFPFYWMFVVATNDKDAAFHIPPFTPGTEFLDNFSRVLERTDFSGR